MELNKGKEKFNGAREILMKEIGIKD